MDEFIKVFKRIVFAIIIITFVNLICDNIVPYSLFNIGFVAIFLFPGMIVLLFMIYFIK